MRLYEDPRDMHLKAAASDRYREMEKSACGIRDRMDRARAILGTALANAQINRDVLGTKDFDSLLSNAEEAMRELQ